MNHNEPWDEISKMSPGSAQRVKLRFPDSVLSGIEIPCIILRGASEGPNLVIVAGVHGGEYPGPAAAIRLSRELDPTTVTGNLVIIPVANQTAFWNRVAFVTPEDGINLNRVFPGNLDGTFSQVLAARFFDAAVRPAEMLIDLHSGDIFESLSPFTGFYNVPNDSLRERSEAIAQAFDVPSINRYQNPEPDNGSLTAAAVQAGVASAIVEVGGNGLLRLDDEATVFNGLLNALRSAGCLDEPRRPTSPTMYEPTDGADAPVSGLWRPDVTLRQTVQTGQRLGVITDEFGDELAMITSPADGEVVFYMTCLPVSAGQYLVALGRPVQS